MKPQQAVLALLATLAAALALAQEGVVELADGGRIVVRANGTMGHDDAAGRPVHMKDGEAMVARDGTRIVMRGDALWRQMFERGAFYYGLASVPPWSAGPANARSIELHDGGRIVVWQDGSMVHYDAPGNRVDVTRGTPMVPKDGTSILMHDETLWSRIADRPASARGSR